MSAETWFRLVFAVIAIGMAIYLAVVLFTGRTRVGRRNVARTAAPRPYWGSVGKTAIMSAGLTIAVIQSSEGQRLPIVFLGLFAGQLFEMLVSGIVALPNGAYSRADRPASYWRWVAFHAAVVVLILGFLVIERTRVTIL